MPISIIYLDEEKIFPVPDRTLTLAELLWLKGDYPSRGHCAGIGTCGLCKVRFLSQAPELTRIETKILTPGEQAAHIRLACRHLAVDGMRLILPENSQDSPMSESRSAMPTAWPVKTLLAVDLGTTSIAWRALDLRGTVLAAGQLPNPQLGLGSEIMSRLALAADQEGANRLQILILDVLKNLCSTITKNYGPVHRIGLAANPAMTLLALGRDPAGLSSAPYRLDYSGNCLEKIDGLPPLWIPPLLSPFVGADLTCGLATLMAEPRPLILADMGTNGEFILLDQGKCLAASVPLGPALEGVGMRCGGSAGPGAVTSFRLDPAGLRALTQDGEEPKFISGSGYLTLLNCLLELGLLDRRGLFVRSGASTDGNPALSALRARLRTKIQDRPDLRLILEHGLYLCAADVENLLKVKAAFSLALALLAEKAGVETKRTDLYLAGALGRNAPLAALLNLGFLPPSMEKRFHVAGNACLDGLCELLPGLDAQGRSQQLSRLEQTLVGCQVLDLANDRHFQESYLRGLSFE